MVLDLEIKEGENQETGQRFITALTERDFNSLQDVFHQDVRARLLIPSGLFTPLDAKGLMEKFRQWFGEATFFNVQQVDINCIGRRIGISYQVLIQDADGWSVAEQHTCSSLENGRIDRFDLMCSGFQPVLPLEGG